MARTRRLRSRGSSVAVGCDALDDNSCRPCNAALTPVEFGDRSGTRVRCWATRTPFRPKRMMGLNSSTSGWQGQSARRQEVTGADRWRSQEVSGHWRSDSGCQQLTAKPSQTPSQAVRSQETELRRRTPSLTRTHPKRPGLGQFGCIRHIPRDDRDHRVQILGGDLGQVEGGVLVHIYLQRLERLVEAAVGQPLPAASSRSAVRACSSFMTEWSWRDWGGMASPFSSTSLFRPAGPGLRAAGLPLPRVEVGSGYAAWARGSAVALNDAHPPQHRSHCGYADVCAGDLAASRRSR